MVYAFLVHTLTPVSCKVVFSTLFGQENAGEDNGEEQVSDSSDAKNLRKAQLTHVASTVSSEYQFRRVVSNKGPDEDSQRTGTGEELLPDCESGFCRLPHTEPFVAERVLVWLAGGNVGFVLVCDRCENRMLAEMILKVIVRLIQEYTKVTQQPMDLMAKLERVGVILNRFLPGGALLFLTNRAVKQLEKSVSVAINN